MECADVKPITPANTGTALEISLEPQLCALSNQYAARGLHKAALDSAIKQMEKEEETRTLAPDAYRLSLLNDRTVNGVYRRGKNEMDTNDLVRYFSETRERRIQKIDFAESGAQEEPLEDASLTSDSQALAQTSSLPILSKVTSLPKRICQKIGTSVPVWFDTAKPDTSRESKRFPLSAFAAVLAVAMSLMLIVASSILLTRTENSISTLKSEISSASSELMDLKSDLEVQNNLIEIRKIAVEEYGMVEEDYIKTQYISLGLGDKVEVFEEEREESVGLSALLSAIGIK